jgi:RimJ/RimL family protein N-acetyltransferase
VVEVVPFDPVLHTEEFRQMNIEYLTWYADQAKERYQIDLLSVVGSIQEYVDDNLESFMSWKPPNGVLYIIEEKGKVAGMGGLRKLRETVGEVKRMYIRPQFRGNGYGKQMAIRLLDEGRKLGCSSFLLDTAEYMLAAQHIYKSVGFKERGVYPESEPPEVMRPYMIFMEKKE